MRGRAHCGVVFGGVVFGGVVLKFGWPGGANRHKRAKRLAHTTGASVKEALDQMAAYRTRVANNWAGVSGVVPTSTIHGHHMVWREIAQHFGTLKVQVNALSQEALMLSGIDRIDKNINDSAAVRRVVEGTEDLHNIAISPLKYIHGTTSARAMSGTHSEGARSQFFSLGANFAVSQEITELQSGIKTLLRLRKENSTREDVTTIQLANHFPKHARLKPAAKAAHLNIGCPCWLFHLLAVQSLTSM